MQHAFHKPALTFAVAPIQRERRHDVWRKVVLVCTYLLRETTIQHNPLLEPMSESGQTIYLLPPLVETGALSCGFTAAASRMALRDMEKL
jgi:hypothetical protein